MKFWTPLETPREFCLAIESAVARKDSPARVSAEVMTMPTHVIVTVSKMGTTAIEIVFNTLAGEPGMWGEVIQMDVAKFHRPFIEQVMSWVEREVIVECGGRILDDFKTVKKSSF